MKGSDERFFPQSVQGTDGQVQPNAIPEAFEQGEERQLMDYLQILITRKWTIITFFIVVVATVLMGTFLTTPIYRASVTLKIDDENSSLILFQNTMIARQAPEEFLQTQYKILKSRNLAKRVIYALGVDTFEPKAKSSQKDAKKPATREDINPEVVNNFLQKVSVSPVSNTRLVMVSFDSPQATVAAATANEIAKAFKEFSTDSKSESTQWARDWLTKQLAEMKVKVEQSEATASKYASQHGIPFELEEMALRGRGGFHRRPHRLFRQACLSLVPARPGDHRPHLQGTASAGGAAGRSVAAFRLCSQPPRGSGEERVRKQGERVREAQHGLPARSSQDDQAQGGDGGV